jgi:N-acetylmuramoyl-L-alanine amidase
MARGIYNAFAQYKNDNHGGSRAPFVREKIKKEKKSKEKQAEEKKEIIAEPRENAELPVQNVQQPVSESKVIYKVQILVTDGVLRKNDNRLKGRTDAEYYKENGMVKYTIGSFDTMREANNYRKELNNMFPGCFVVKFQDGKRVQ